MATSKALRTAPVRLLDNYVASIKYLRGPPETIPDDAFLRSNYLEPNATSTVGTSQLNNRIGFNFTVNNITFSQFGLTDYGWLFLQNPNDASPAFADVVSTSTNNTTIIQTFAGYEHIVIAPWFDQAVKPLETANLLSLDATYDGTITSGVLSDIQAGLNNKNWPYSTRDRGARFGLFNSSKKGRYLLVRWTVSQSNFKSKLKFEVALYESGRIEFRYWPLQSYEPGDVAGSVSSATVGIFWNGTTAGTANRFRDFAPLLGYQRESRTISPFGGASYSASYTDSTIVYSVGLTETNNWPRNGAVITFSPPVKTGTFLPRKIIGDMSATRQLVRSPGSYDDRKTILYTSGTLVHAPSTLPSRLTGDSGDVDVSLRQLLFVSGSDAGNSMLVSSNNSKTSKSAINKLLSQLDSIEALNREIDRSFNESQKNYIATTSTSSFYASGSALDDVGMGFTSPLKSKTQFTFSLPVENPTTMLSLTSSIYYYDEDLRKWTMPVAESYMSRIRKYTTNPLVLYDYVSSASYRVVETALGFDAVGRKVVSGSLAFSPTTNQSDFAIGSFFNAPVTGTFSATSVVTPLDSGSNSKDAISRTYSNSITDNINFFPSESCRINFPIDAPFLIEKVVVNLPLYINGAWFNDLTTCNKPFGDVGQAAGLLSGAIDFGGPGITFSLLCGRKAPGVNYLDIIASGTITHVADNTKNVVLYKNTGMNVFALRPTGFLSFSNPSTVISGSGNIYDGKARLEIAASVAGGLTLARNDRSTQLSNVASNRTKCTQLLTSPTLISAGEDIFNGYDLSGSSGDATRYAARSTRIYLQQISPLSRGKTGVEFNGNSILGGTVAYYHQDVSVTNPLYYSSSLSSEFTSKIASANFTFESIAVYSLVDSRNSPYLMLPGDKLTFAVSKTRPSAYKMFRSVNIATGTDAYESYQLTGSHGTVMLNTGSIDIIVYGSYVREGEEFNP